MTKATLASQRAEIAELQEQLSQKDECIQELESKLDATPDEEQPESAPRLPDLTLTGYLPRALDEVVTCKDGTTFNVVKVGQNKEGVNWLKWDMQASFKDEASGKVFYSKNRFKVKALGELRDQIAELIESDNRLVELTASYLPYELPSRDNQEVMVQFDEYLIKSVRHIPRKTAAEQTKLAV